MILFYAQLYKYFLNVTYFCRRRNSKSAKNVNLFCNLSQSASLLAGRRCRGLFRNAGRDYPTYTVVRREIKRNTGKESYRGLTYQYMEAYIDAHENAAVLRKEYDELKFLAECHSIRFPHIKAWFLRTFPEVKAFGTDPKPDQDPLTLAA